MDGIGQIFLWFLGLVLILWVLVKCVIPLMTWRGRRLLWGRWQRLSRWEFWPIWAVYLPVVIWLFVIGIRLRGFLFFLNANPVYLLSGIAMGSKEEILEDLQKVETERIRVAKYWRLAPDDSEGLEEALRDFGYPLVLKPDVGERGQGVAVIRNRVQLDEWIGVCEENYMVQQYIGGLEYGVHWLRMPGDEKGCVSSICAKLPQVVVGDGEQTLERLILSDERAVMMAGYYFNKYEDELGRVLAKGERFSLVEIGTHSRGSVFTDERELWTEALAEAFDEMSCRHEGFYFGRYDVKVPSLDDFQKGKNIMILELNAVAGEPAHIYQPGYSWWRGIRDLSRHWEKACRIGKENVKRGEKAVTWGEFWHVFREYSQKERLEVDALNQERGNKPDE